MECACPASAHLRLAQFADEAARVLLGVGIPREIVELPNELLATPLGMQLRPLIEGMQSH